MTTPNFIIAGATRSGTSSLHSYLRVHPDIFMPSKKELWFFNTDPVYSKGLEHYAAMFDNYDGEAAVGEATPMYMEKGFVYGEDREVMFRDHDDAMERIAKDLPNCRIILSLRNPVDRILSVYWKNFYQGRLGSHSLDYFLQNELEQGCQPKRRTCFLYRNYYDLHVRRIIDLFSEDRVHVVIFEEWIENVERMLEGILGFLGVDTSFTSEQWAKSRNARGGYRRVTGFADRVKNAAVYLRMKLKEKEIEKRITEHLRPHVHDLRHILGGKIRHWSQFC